MNLKGRKALVVGLGKSGVAAAKLLVREGADVAVADAKPAESLRAALEAVGSGVCSFSANSTRFVVGSITYAAVYPLPVVSTADPFAVAPAVSS